MNTNTEIRAFGHGPRVGVCEACEEETRVCWTVDRFGEEEHVAEVCADCARMLVDAELYKALVSIELSRSYRARMRKALRARERVRKLKGFLGWGGEEETGNQEGE